MNLTKEEIYELTKERLCEEIDILTAKVKRYEEVLEFYADPINWDGDDRSLEKRQSYFIETTESDIEMIEDEPNHFIGGKRARAALNNGGESK